MIERRNFLKLIGACVIIPGIVIAAVKVKPKRSKKVIVYDKAIYPKGVTDKQLKELAQITLKDLPKGILRVDFT